MKSFFAPPAPRQGPASAQDAAAAAPRTSRRVQNIPRGILFMIAATCLIAVSNALSKWLVAIYPVGELMFARSASSLMVCAVVILPVTGFGVFATSMPRAHMARGLSQSISQTFTVLALSMMPLAGATAIGFSAPLFAALLSILWLKERADWMRWAVLVAGFVGVLIVTSPGSDTFQLGALFALANAVMYGSVTVAVRGMTKTESANCLLMWQMLTMAILHSLLLAFGVKWPTPIDAAMMMAGGAANAAAQYCWTRALHLAPTTAASPFYYFLLVWSVLLGYAVWGEVPTLALLIGSAIVVASGLALLWHEARRGRAAAQAATTPPSSVASVASARPQA
jgi:drug/metabolite transporter (DMT)-like permease